MHLVCDYGLTAVIDIKIKYRSNRNVERDICVTTLRMKARFLGTTQKGRHVYSLPKYGIYFYSCLFRMKSLTLF